MKFSPKTVAIVYIVLGVIFFYMATQTAGETIWNVPTVILLIFATLEFGVGFRLIAIHLHLKNKDDDK